MDQAKKAFTAVEGDHMSYLNIFNGYMAARDKKRWCKEHQVNQRSMVKVLEIRDQLVGYWEGSAKWRLEKDNSSMEEVSDNIRKTFLSGFFENVAFLMPNGQYQNFVDQEVRSTFLNPQITTSCLVFAPSLRSLVASPMILDSQLNYLNLSLMLVNIL
jgi:HrpA-like RNA helicase